MNSSPSSLQFETANPKVSCAGNNANLRRAGPSETLKPLFLVPFSRDDLFINRVDIFNHIDNSIVNHRRLALSGIGGVGLVIFSNYHL